MGEVKQARERSLVLKDKNFWTVIKVILFLIVLGTISVYVVAASYAVFGGDDASHYMNYVDTGGTNLFAKAFNYMKFWYSNVSGIYFTILFQSLMAPFQWGGRAFLRILITISVIAFFGLLYWALVSVFKLFKFEKGAAFFLYCFTIITITNIRLYPEFFYWYSAQCGYLIPLNILLLGICLMLKGNACSQKRYYVASSICMFLMSGGYYKLQG